LDGVRRQGSTRDRPGIVTCGITGGQANRFGLPRSGTTPLAIEPLSL
jgi:hypothetical protein